MPTSAKLTAALFFAVLFLYCSFMVLPTFEPNRPPENFFPVNGALAAAIGWRILGRNAGEGYRPTFSFGVTALVLACFWVLLVNSLVEMFERAWATRYRGPIEALNDGVGIFINYAQQWALPEVLLLLGCATIVISAIVEFVARRWS